MEIGESKPERYREPARSFTDLVVWQKSHQLVLEVYRISKDFPNTEVYGLSAQLRRAAVSVAANIAEGFRKRGKLDKVRFLNMAEGSIEECRYYLILAEDLKYCPTAGLLERIEEISKLLNSYSKAILKG